MPHLDWSAPFRAELPACTSTTYLNTGTAGPIPRASAAALSAELDFELQHGRGNFATWGRFFERIERCRGLAARLLGASPEEVALTHHSSEGINIVLWGLDWRPGDELVTTTLEHDAIAIPIGILQQRHGVKLRFADIGKGEPAPTLEALKAVIGPRTRLVALSHIAYSSGAVLAIPEVAELAHAVGAKLLVDGAQTCGARPLQMQRLGADFYTLSGQKWVLGPEGTGALFVAAHALETLHPTFASYFAARTHDFRGNVELQPDARRYETGMVHRPSWAAFETSARWLLDDVGLERAWQQSLHLAKLARQGLEAISGVELITPQEASGPLLSFDLPDHSPAQLFALSQEFASEQHLIIRSTPQPPYCLRAAFGFFNNEADVAELLQAVTTASCQDPARLSLEGYAAKLPAKR